MTNSRWRTDAILKVVFWLWWHIGQLIRNLDQRRRITCRYTSRDQNGNFRKFKMAHGRHFKNSFIFICQPWIISFLSNLVWEFPFRGWLFDKNRSFANSRWWSKLGSQMKNHKTSIWSCDKNVNFLKFKMADGGHFENNFISISQTRIIRFQSNLICMWISIPRTVSWWTIEILHSRWQSDAILKIGNQLYLGANFSDLREFKFVSGCRITCKHGHWKWTYYSIDWVCGRFSVFPETHRFWDTRLVIMTWPWNPAYSGHSKSSEPRHVSIRQRLPINVPY